MPLFRRDEQIVARAVSGLAQGNPFLPERIEHERQALGSAFVVAHPVWHLNVDRPENPNVAALSARAAELLETARRRLDAGGRGARLVEDEADLYEDLVFYALFDRYADQFFALITEPAAAARRVDVYDRFARDLDRYLVTPAAGLASSATAPHLFACGFQVRRAFHFIHRNILGGSMPAARLRAQVWQSIFTRDLKRYRRTLYQLLGDVTTLVTGPSGTGKELVARAVALSRYIPFDPATRRFTEDFASAFYPLNLSALSPTLIESELFGHRRGAFTGAVQDRAGWLEVCPRLGTVFLDEIGEIDRGLQVKLLRVIETRAFQRLGDTRDRAFRGKIVGATNRELGSEMQAGRFRADLYYRLCGDLIRTPSLREQLDDQPGERRALVRAIVERVAGVEGADLLAEEVERWIDTRLGVAYGWPGNFRELEQCVRNVMIRGEYHPSSSTSPTSERRLTDGLLDGSLTADALLRRYCTMVYAKTGSYQETARRLELDRRTIRDKVDRKLLAELREGGWL